MKALAAVVVLAMAIGLEAQHDLDPLSGLSCPKAGYMFPDAENLCFVWFCERAGEAPIKRMCPKGVRVPTWWTGGEVGVCNIVNIVKHGGEPVCLRCAADDVQPDDSCAARPFPCDEGCTCVDIEHTHKCDCPVTLGVVGDGSVPAPVDHCSPEPCVNGGTCQNQWDGFFCFCPNGWTGHRCETSVCDWHPCLNGGTCVIDEIGYHCECTDCWGGSCCNETKPECGIEEPGCGPCHEGPGCKTVKNTCGCQPDLCVGGGVCVDGPKGATCEDCPDCFTGKDCKDPIKSCKCGNTCPLNARCEDLSDLLSYECICNECWEGKECDMPITSCTCNNPCSKDQTCTLVNGQPQCGCADPCRTGANCEQIINTCECANPCSAGQECSKVGEELTCSCTDPCKTGPYCDQTVQTCACANPCVNGGICAEEAGALTCHSCDACFTGPYCNEKVVSCECNSPCGQSEVCNMVDGAPVCGCPDCMTGDYCDIPVDTCACNNPCNNKDTCQDVGGTAQCVCDCTGNEECREHPETYEKECKCPVCFFNAPGETGCLSPVKNLCICNNPCTADQQVCVDGPPGGHPICKIGNPSSGNAFTVVFEENDSEKSFREIPLELYLTPSVPDSGHRSVNIRSAGLKEDHHCYFNVNKTIEENSVLRFPVERCMMHNKTGLEKLAIRLTELNNDTMLVYGINKDRWTADGFLATPDVQAGSSFQTVSYAPAHISTQFAIIALFDDTDVTIELADDNDLPPPYNTRGSIYKLTMQAFETFQVQARCPNAPKSKKRQCAKDLSGSIITANNKIHVHSGNVRAFVKAGEGLSRDHLVEEMVPTDRWGKEFGMVSVPGRAVGDILNVMALKGRPTNVDIYYGDKKESFSLPQNGRLNVYKEIPSDSLFYIKSDQPLSVTQLTKSKDTYLYKNESFHDPVTITIPPVAQFTNNFFISTPLFTGGENFQLQPYEMNLALLVARKGEEQYIQLDKKPLTYFKMPWTDLPVPEGSSERLVGAVIEIQHGTRLISNTHGHNFQCVVYGYDDRESYGFPAAMNQAVMKDY